MSYLSAEPYWTKLTDHYYDHVHWDLNGARTELSLRSWLQQHYDCRYVHHKHQLEFDSEKAATWFRLAWD